MAGKDITIRITPIVDKNKAKSELNTTIEQLEKEVKKINLGIDSKKLATEINNLKKQIDSITSGKKKSGNTDTFKNEAESAKKLTSEYKRLIQEKKKLETQMSKSSFKGQSYKALSKELDGVNKKIVETGKQIDGLNKKNIKSDITSNLASSFESVTKQANSLSTALDNALKNKDYTSNQLAQLTRLKNSIESIKSNASLNDILKADKPYEEMSKLMTAIDKVKNSYENLKVTNGFSKNIQTAQSDVTKLQAKIKELYNSGYGNTSAIDKLYERAKELSKTKISVNDEDAKSKLRNLISDTEKLESKYNELKSSMSINAKTDAFKVDVSKTIKDLEKLKEQYVSLGKDTSAIDNMKGKLEGLNKLSFAEGQQQLTNYKNEINKMATEIPKATSSMAQYNTLMKERASLEKQMSTTINTQAYDALKAKLQENLQKIQEVSAGLDGVSKKQINPDIGTALIKTFDKLQGQVTKTSENLDKLKSKNLTGDQVAQLQRLEQELNNLKNVDLNKLLKSDRAHEDMAKLLQVFDQIRTTARELQMNAEFNNQVDSAYKKVEQLEKSLQNLKNYKGFTEALAPGGIENLIKIFNETIKGKKINLDSTDARNQLKTLQEAIQAVESEILRLNQLSNTEKSKFINTQQIDSLKQKVEDLKTVYQTLGKDTSGVENLYKSVSELANLPMEEAKAKLSLYREEYQKLNNTLGQTTGSQKAGASIRELTSLLEQKARLEQNMSKVPMGTQQYDALNNKLTEVNGKIETVKKSLGDLANTEMKTSTLIAYAKEFSNIESKIASTRDKMHELESSARSIGQVSRLGAVGSELEKLRNIKLSDILKLDKPYEEISRILSRISELESKLKDVENNINIGKKLSEEFSTAESKISSLAKAFATFEKTNKFGSSQLLTTFKQNLEQIKNTRIDINDVDAEEKLKRLTANIELCERQFKELQANAKIDAKQFNLDTAIEKATKNLDALENKFKTLNKSTSEIATLRTQLEGLDKLSLKEADAQLKKINNSISQMNRESGKATQSQQRLSQSVTKTGQSASKSAGMINKFTSNLYSSLSTYSLGNIIGIQLTKGIYAIGETITELDSAFRDLEKVAPASFTGTYEELARVRDMAYQTGQEVARSSVDIINSTASAFQLGIDNLADAMNYAKQVNMYANVAVTKYCLYS